MIETVKLKKAVDYSDSRINIDDVTLENFVTIDNLLQNKLGLTKAINLPPQNGNMPAFDVDNILVANIRPYLRKIWFADRAGGCSADVLVFNVNKEFHPKFVYYAIFRDDFFDHMMRGSKGTKMPRGDKTQILDFILPKLKKGTQQKIAAALSALDAKIELNNRINAELEAMAKLLYDYWFVQFDFPDANGNPYKSSGGKMVFNKELKRKIPEGWEDGTLGAYVNLTRGVTYSKNDVTDSSHKNSIPILRATNISNEEIDLNDMVYVSDSLVSNDQIMAAFDVLITMSSGSKDHVGKKAFYYFDEDVAFGAFCTKINIAESQRFFVGNFLKSDYFRKYITNVCLGTNINNLTNGHLTDCKMIGPEPEVILDFENRVCNIYKKIGNNLKQNQHLAELRDWLLPMLMNGQVSVK